MNANVTPSLLQPIEILLVEDDPADVKLTRRALEQDKIANNIYVARDGVEAMAFLRREGSLATVPRPDLVLLDLNMPRMDGRETLQAIKSDANLKSIPVVIVTTSDDRRDINMSYLKHANSYVTKPIDLEQFRTLIQSVREYWFSVVRLPTKA
jgi:CheY-like chemotaxis protein